MSDGKATLLDHLKSWPLALLPHGLLSRLVRVIARCRLRLVKDLLISAFMRRFAIDLSEAETGTATDYPDFNSFFTRALKPGARLLPEASNAISCPVDGFVSQAGQLDQDRILQAKGHHYSLSRLLGGDPGRAAPFLGGHFATLYLSPRDYHRIHMPVDGRLVETVYVPGRLYSVAPHTTRAIPGLFARNERLICLFETASGPMAVVMVGAIFVSCMETVWGGVVNPRMRGALQSRRHDLPEGGVIELARGMEMGRFNMGSTVIVLFGPDQAHWLETLQAGMPVKMGDVLGTLTTANQPPSC
jgi:phosphatidylserine decarboxylase